MCIVQRSVCYTDNLQTMSVTTAIDSDRNLPRKLAVTTFIYKQHTPTWSPSYTRPCNRLSHIDTLCYPQRLNPISKPPNRVRIHTQIIPPTRLIRTINHNHILDTYLTQCKSLHTAIALDAEDAILAYASATGRVRARAGNVVVLEEGVQAAAVDEDVL
jgi:hypothetical protein